MFHIEASSSYPPSVGGEGYKPPELLAGRVPHLGYLLNIYCQKRLVRNPRVPYNNGWSYFVTCNLQSLFLILLLLLLCQVFSNILLDFNDFIFASVVL